MTMENDQVTVVLSTEAAQHALDAVSQRRSALLDQAQSSKRERVRQDAFRAADRLDEASIALSYVLGRSLS